MKLLGLKNVMITCFFFGVFGLLILGAVTVTLGRSSQIRHTEHALERARHWHSQISSEVPLSQKQSWSNLGNEYPFQLLTACTTEEKDQNSASDPQ